jgi:hypothetical protein
MGISGSGSELCVLVLDESPAPLPHASITVISLIECDQSTYSASTAAKGKACLAIPEGSYSVKARLTGFMNVRYSPVSLTYLYPIDLRFRLPVGDSGEEGLYAEVQLDGTLRFQGKPVPNARICILQRTRRAVTTSGRTNVFREYALAVPPDRYYTEIQTASGQVYRSQLDVLETRRYRNVLMIKQDDGR